jgi:hypothetical protein
MSRKIWDCPQECPFQSDDGAISTSLSILSRVTLPILTAAIVGFHFWTITDKENRALTTNEFVIGASALFMAYQPTLFQVAVKAIAKKYFK